MEVIGREYTRAYVCEGSQLARAYVACLRHLQDAKDIYVSDIGGDRQLSHGDLPTAIMAGVTHNNADVIAPRFAPRN